MTDKDTFLHQYKYSFCEHMKLYFMRFLSACVAVSTCALSSCSSDTYIGNYIPASSVPYIAAGARDYRDQPTDGISEIDAGRYIIDNREDKFSSGVLEVCNSSFSVDGQLAEEIGQMYIRISL